MFEDKRFNNKLDEDNNSNIFFGNKGINDDLGNDNLSFNSYHYVPEPEPINRKPKKEKNYKWLKYLIIGGITIILVILLFVVILNILMSPSKIYKEAVNYSYVHLKNYIKEIENKSLDYDPSLDSITFYGNLQLENDLFEDLNNYTFDYNLGLDINNSKAQAIVALNKNNKSLLNFNSYILNKNLYVQASQIYDKLILLKEFEDLDFNSLKTNFSHDDILDILDFLNEYVTNHLDNSKISKTTETIQINAKNYKVTSNIYSLSEEDVQKEFVNLVDAIINDDSTLRAFANLTNETKKELKAYLEELKVNDEFLSSLKAIKFKIFTKGLASNVLGFSFYYDDTQVLQYTNKDNIVNISINYDYNKIEIVKNIDLTDVVLYKNEDEIIKASIATNDDTTNIDFEMQYEANTLSGNLAYVLKRIGDKRQTIELELDLDIPFDNETTNFKLFLSNTTQVGDKVANIKTTDAVKFDDLTESDLKIIEDNFKKVMEGTLFEDIFNSFASDTNCSLAADCVCENDICTCKYIDENGLEENIICIK